MIQETLKKLKEDWLLVATIVLIGVLSFGLGRLSALYGGESYFSVVYPTGQEAAVIGSSVQGIGSDEGSALQPTTFPLQPTPSTLEPSDSGGGFVASKSGSKYHLPWCPGAKAIKEENKVYFATKEEAEARGYTPAANCKGL